MGQDGPNEPKSTNRENELSISQPGSFYSSLSLMLASNVREDSREDLAHAVLYVFIQFHNPSHVSYISTEPQMVHEISTGC